VRRRERREDKKKRNRCVREKDEALICHDSGILF
jgi:hypothetical protein